MILQEYFKTVTDKRQERKVKHNLLEIIVMTICAVIAGCEVWEDICDYCRVKEAWFRSSPGMKLEHGIPSHGEYGSRSSYCLEYPKKLPTELIPRLKTMPLFL